METFDVLRRSMRIGLAALTLACLATFPARASMITFTLTPQGGSSRLSYGGGAAALEAKDLGVSAVTGVGTPDHDGTAGALAVSRGSLSFTTGPNTDSPLVLPHTQWNFAPGGSVLLVGGIPALGIPDGTPLIVGGFNGKSVVLPLDGSDDLKMQGGAIMNVVNDKLAAYFGLPAAGFQYKGGISTFFSTSANPPASFSSSGFSSGSLTTQPVPEPTSLLVFVAAMGAGIVAYRRRPR